MDQLRLQLRVVFYRDGDLWIAHCLEMGVMGHGPTRREALVKMSQAIAIQIEQSVTHGNLANLFMPSDPELLRMFFAGARKVEGEAALITAELPGDRGGVMVETIDAREYTGELALA